MTIRQTTLERLDQLLPRRRAIGQFIGTEVEWLADPPGNIVGIIAEGPGMSNWGYVVLRRDETGNYHFWDLEAGIATRDSARLQIVRIMKATQPNDRNHSPLVG
jgi:hypothetical protein